MVLVFIPYWLILRGISLVWRCCVSGWHAGQLAALMPTTLNLVGGFLSVPFVYFLILLGAEAMKHAQARQEEEVQAGRLARQLSDARLALLQRQLHPHFLFNALQAISTLLHRDPATADRLLVRLSGLLRAMLDDASGQTLSLRDGAGADPEVPGHRAGAVRRPPVASNGAWTSRCSTSRCRA